MKKLLAVLTILLALVVVMAALPALGETAATPAAAATKTTAAAGKIDINRASKEELTKIDGIDDTISAKIIDGRPYKTKRDLLTRKIVNQATYTKISDKIIAHAVKPAATPKAK